MIRKDILISILSIIPALIIYSFFCREFNFTQDDAFISYRYVANFLNGHGLVYNIAERIEGFTNFGWIIYLSLWGAAGVNIILASKITGFVLGGGIIICTYVTSRMVFGQGQLWYALLPAYLVAVNQSLAYWSPAGLETAAFAFVFMLVLIFYLRHSWLLIAALILAVWIRPEGALLAGILIVIEALLKKDIPSFSILCSAVALILSLPYVIFKYAYYGSILPNPFYAKTVWNFNQLIDGLEYSGQFLYHYGFFGVGLIVSLLFWKKLNREARVVFMLSVLYIGYVIIIGGDVLKVHRFFIPIVGLISILSVQAIWLFTRRVSHKTKMLYLFIFAILMLGFTYHLPRAYVHQYLIREQSLTSKMTFLSSEMKRWEHTDFSVAIPTIGVFGYNLLGHEIIDMLGLTDSVIARHSEEPIPGMQTTWKEQKHNSRYLLQKAPNYIVFSTGGKASAPAERALLLYEEFINAYRIVGWSYVLPGSANRIIIPAFKLTHDITGEIKPTHPVEYVQYYSIGQNLAEYRNYPEAIEYFDSALSVSPEPYNISLMCDKAFCYFMLGQADSAISIYNEVLATDSAVFQAHKDMYAYSVQVNDREGIALHGRWLDSLTPWYRRQ